MAVPKPSHVSGEPPITSDQALQIARLDAETAYRDLYDQ
jgi:hypothetical protein